MEDYPMLYSKVVLIKGMDLTTLIGKSVRLEIDGTYTIENSIAVLFNESVIGHLSKILTRTVWRHLHGKIKLQADIYRETNGMENCSLAQHAYAIFQIGSPYQGLLWKQRWSIAFLSSYYSKSAEHFPRHRSIWLPRIPHIARIFCNIFTTFKE